MVPIWYNYWKLGQVQKQNGQRFAKYYGLDEALDFEQSINGLPEDQWLPKK